MDDNSTGVLSLYDFASKQEYIYKTSKIKEISGASVLLAGMYEKFIDELKEKGIKVTYKGSDGKYASFTEAKFTASDSHGQVLFDGGGNLMVLYKSEEIYKKANQILSVILLTEYPGIHMIASFVNKTENFSKGDNSDVSRLYRQNRRDKNLFPAYDLTGVTPFTQLDPMTFLPVTRKFGINGDGNPYPHSKISLSEDRFVKARKYNEAKKEADKEDSDKKETAAYEEGLAAVIYIDGNSMGRKLTSLASESYDNGVEHLRFFSENVQKNYVTDPLKAIRKENIEFRKIIGGGDEITLICHAEDALKVVKTYFDCLKARESVISEDRSVIPEDCRESYYGLVSAKTKEEQTAALENTSCAGIAIIHAKSPFTVAYELAEAACENAKEKAHTVPGNYLDFYYCHAGATADFDTLRDAEQNMTARPYAYYGTVNPDAAALEKLDRLVPVLQLAGRANVKALGTAAQKGQTEFTFEIERVNAYMACLLRKPQYSHLDPKKYVLQPGDLRMTYDISEFYDIWFRKEDEEGKENEA